MGNTTFQARLLAALDQAIARRDSSVEGKLHAMLIAIDNGWYAHLPRLLAALPPDHAAQLGEPPSSADDDG